MTYKKYFDPEKRHTFKNAHRIRIRSRLGNLRRSRGYNFEHSLVQRFNAEPQWHARRLGGSSTGLPDIVAINNAAGILLTIEAKSGTGDTLYVPQDQLERCMLVTRMFSLYPQRHIILAFKFMGKKRFRRKNKTVYEPRRLATYYKVADLLSESEPLPIVKCTYSGKTFAIRDSRSVELDLPEYEMPFSGARQTVVEPVQVPISK